MESDKSYGDGPVPYKEEQALQPGGVYEASKASAGHVAHSYFANYQLPGFTVRAANVYGPNDPNQSRIIPNTIRRIRNGQPPQVTFGANAFMREFIHIEDFIHIITKLMKIGPWGEAINVGTGEIATISSVVKKICREMAVAYEEEEWDEPGDLKEIPVQQLDLTKLCRMLAGLQTPISLTEGLRRTVECT